MSQQTYDKNCYQELNISMNATSQEIKKAYHSLAKQYHPDKGGDKERFQSISSAYEILSNPSTKRAHDLQWIPSHRYSTNKRVNQHSFQSSFTFHVNRNTMFSQPTKPSSPTRPKRIGQSKRCKIPFSLVDSWFGKKIKLSFTRKILCKDCKGYGGSPHSQCPNCFGKGVCKTIKHKGMSIETTWGDCYICQSTGYVYKKQHQCSTCSGKRYLFTSISHLYQIPKGVRDNTIHTIPNLGNEEFMGKTGDLLITFYRNHKIPMKRIQNDLYIDKTISVIDALCGFTYEVIHFNKKKITITIKPSQIQLETYTQCIHKMGMPIDDTGLYGNLYINYTISFPSSLDTETIQQIRNIIPKDSTLSVNFLENTSSTK